MLRRDFLRNLLASSVAVALPIPKFVYEAPMTNFAVLTPAQKLVWSRSVWQAARNQSYMQAFDS